MPSNPALLLMCPSDLPASSPAAYGPGLSQTGSIHGIAGRSGRRPSSCGTKGRIVWRRNAPTLSSFVQPTDEMFGGTVDVESDPFPVSRALTPSHPTGQILRTGVFYPIRGLNRGCGGKALPDMAVSLPISDSRSTMATAALYFLASNPNGRPAHPDPTTTMLTCIIEFY